MTAKPRPLPSGKYQGAYRGPDGRWRTKTFPTAAMAERWAQDGESTQRLGHWTDPRAEKATVEHWHERWSAGRVVEPNTARLNEWLWDSVVKPRWARWPAASITREAVQGWVADITPDYAPSTVRKAVGLLGSVLAHAVDARALRASPVQRLQLPTDHRPPPRWLTVDEHRRLVAATDERVRSLVAVGPYVGLRIGELLGLRVGRVDLKRRQLLVVETVTEPGGVLTVKPYGKTATSQRAVPLTDEAVQIFEPVVKGRAENDHVWRTSRGKRTPYRPTNFRSHYWRSAVKKAQLTGTVTPHVMRHTAASWLVQAGVPLYDVQEFLGHGSVQMTQRYAHLSPSYGARIREAFAQVSHEPLEKA